MHVAVFAGTLLHGVSVSLTRYFLNHPHPFLLLIAIKFLFSFILIPSQAITIHIPVVNDGGEKDSC